MRIRHLNCGTFCPLGGRLMDGISTGFRGRLVCLCLMIETGSGLVLVDTGLGLDDMRRPFPRLSRLNASLLNIRFDPEQSAVRQIERLGLAARDVRHIVLTHLDFDHAGGLMDFPEATVHVLADEAAAAVRRAGFIGRQRYRPRQWGDPARWRRYRPQGEPWFGFEAVRDLEGLPPEILFVPLPGHTPGHAGVAVRAGPGWLLHAGDAYFHHGELEPAGRAAPPGLLAYERMMQTDRAARLHNQDRLRQLAGRHAGEVCIVCSHDPAGFDRLAADLTEPAASGARPGPAAG